MTPIPAPGTSRHDSASPRRSPTLPGCGRRRAFRGSTTIRTSIRPSSRHRSMIISGERRRRASTGFTTRSAADQRGDLTGALVQGVRYDEGNRAVRGHSIAHSANSWPGPTRSPEPSSCIKNRAHDGLGPSPPRAGSSRPRSCIRDTADWDPPGEADLDGVRPGRSRTGADDRRYWTSTPSERRCEPGWGA